MQKLKLTELILSLSPSELKRLGDFIRSPFFNKNKKLVSLYEYFEKAVNESSVDKLNKENLWDHISPEDKFSDTKFRSYLSDLKKLVEKFIIIIEEEKYPVREKNNLLYSLSIRNSQKNFDVTAKEIGNVLKNEFTKNSDHYLNRSNLERYTDFE